MKNCFCSLFNCQQNRGRNRIQKAAHGKNAWSTTTECGFSGERSRGIQISTLEMDKSGDGRKRSWGKGVRKKQRQAGSKSGGEDRSTHEGSIVSTGRAGRISERAWSL